MIDLSEKTNTDLKLEFGTANFTTLAEADTNYALLISDCEKAADLLSDAGRNEEAYTLLDYAARISGYGRLREKANTLHNFMTDQAQ